MAEPAELSEEQFQRYARHLILDEVFVAFGRLGHLLVCAEEGVVPDFLCLAKGLTAGYLPLAAIAGPAYPPPPAYGPPPPAYGAWTGGGFGPFTYSYGW